MKHFLLLVILSTSVCLMASCGREADPDANPAALSKGKMNIDLATRSLNTIQIGKPFSSAVEPFGNLQPDGTLELLDAGLEIGAIGELFEYVIVTLEDFDGTLSVNGTQEKIENLDTIAKVVEKFGEPYWKDNSEGETILFYEYENGTIELLFEFSDGEKLAMIGLYLHGVLFDAEQRKMYNVDKPWPPADN